jgi:hypothetical protein
MVEYNCGFTSIEKPACIKEQGGIWKVTVLVPRQARVLWRSNNPNWSPVVGGTRVEQTSESPGFTGGQCVNVRYTVEFNARRRNATVPLIEQIANINGEIRAIRIINRGIFDYADATGEATYRYRVDIVFRNASTGLDQTSTSFYDRYASFSVNRVFRQDGLPDNCGDPPARYTLKVFDCKGKLLEQQLSDKPFETQAQPCYYDKADLREHKIDLKTLPKVVPRWGLLVQQLDLPTKGASIVIVPYPNRVEWQRYSFPWIEVFSPDCCDLYPQVCWKCIPGGCSPGLCEVKCRDHLCCYDRDGNLKEKVYI